ncbi:MAG: hypothetical protein ACP5J3_14230, partial [Pyrobaculum sp.]
MRAWWLLILALVAVALYIIFLTPQGERVPTTTPTTPWTTPAPTSTAHGPTTATQTTQQPAQTLTATQTSQTSQSTTPATPQPSTTTSSAPTPVLEVQIAAPAEVNLTKLPALINYTVVVKNVGAAAARVEVDGESRELGPGQVWRVEKAINATSAGEYRAAVVVNGKKYEKVMAVRYYEARLVAEPVAINVTKLPQNITVTARVKNVGNLTARLDGVEIPPGAAALVNKTLYVDAAGSYVIRLGLLEIPVKVGYLHAACGAEVEAPAEVEVVPGEAVAYRVVVKNTGNTTAICVVDNKPYRLEPGEAASLTKSLTVETAGSYRAEVEINGTTYRREITAKVIKIFVWFKLKSPRETSYGTTPFTEIIYSDSPQAGVEYVWRISTNATRRTVTVVVDGRGYA